MELAIFFAIIAAPIVWAIVIYNNLVTFKRRAANGFAQIEVQLKRRYDLIPNLIESAKGALAHERETLHEVVRARNAAAAGLKAAADDPTNASLIQRLGEAEGALGSALGRMNVVLEAYPDLKANENLKQLSEELASTENKVAFARQAYNDQVTEYNTYKETFPPALLAPMFGHRKEIALLDYEDRAAFQAAPKLSFS